MGGLLIETGIEAISRPLSNEVMAECFSGWRKESVTGTCVTKPAVCS